MINFDVNLSILFTELPLLERPAAAKAAGFDAVEFWWPFSVEPQIPRMAGRSRNLGHREYLHFATGE